MSIFSAAIDAMFRDRNIASDALWRVAGGGGGVPVRVIRQAPDALVEFNAGRFVVDTVRMDVRVSDVADLSPGDTFEIDGVLYEVTGEPRRDTERLVWQAEVREL